MEAGPIGGAHKWDECFYKKRHERDDFSALHCMRTQRRWLSTNQKRAFTRNQIGWHPDLGLPGPQNCEKLSVPCLSHPVFCSVTAACAVSNTHKCGLLQQLQCIDSLHFVDEETEAQGASSGHTFWVQSWVCSFYSILLLSEKFFFQCWLHFKFAHQLIEYLP